MGLIGGAMATDGAEGAEVDGRGGEDEARRESCTSRDLVVAGDETSMDLDAGLRAGLVGAVNARALVLVIASDEEVGGEVGLRKVDVPATETGVVRPPEPEERCLPWVPLSEELPLAMMSWSKVMSSRSPAGVETGVLARLLPLEDLSSDRSGNGRIFGCGRLDLERLCLAFLMGGEREVLGLDSEEGDGERRLLMTRVTVDDGMYDDDDCNAQNTYLMEQKGSASSPNVYAQLLPGTFRFADILAASRLSLIHRPQSTTHDPRPAIPVQTTLSNYFLTKLQTSISGRFDMNRVGISLLRLLLARPRLGKLKELIGTFFG